MSASLVGSEMCIRDSLYSAPVLRAQVATLPGHSPALAPAVFATSSFAAVSYTHLTLPTICSV
eukprot:10683599-Alexandrium_andersonii.AAC.1